MCVKIGGSASPLLAFTLGPTGVAGSGLTTSPGGYVDSGFSLISWGVQSQPVPSTVIWEGAGWVCRALGVLPGSVTSFASRERQEWDCAVSKGLP